MRRWAPAALLAAVLLLLVIAGRRGAQAQGEGERALTAADENRVLQRVPVRASEPARLRARLAQDPRDLDAALRLARLDIEAARRESDPRYLGHAQAALAPWWNEPSAPHDVVVLRATVKQSNHDFSGALADLDAALAGDPGDPQAWLTRATLLQLRGDFAAARESCRRLARLTSELVTAACLAGVDGITGHAQPAYAGLARAVERNQDDAATRAWAATTLAELALRLGDGERAERHFKQAMTLAIDGYLLSDYADFLLDAGRPAEVVSLLAEQTAADSLLLRLVEAEAQLGSSEHAGELGARYQASRERGDRIHLREEARFELRVAHHPQAALELALADWDIQKEPADVRLLLEAATAARQPGAAAPALAWLDASGCEDPRLRALAAEARR